MSLLQILGYVKFKRVYFHSLKIEAWMPDGLYNSDNGCLWLIPPLSYSNNNVMIGEKGRKKDCISVPDHDCTS